MATAAKKTPAKKTTTDLAPRKASAGAVADIQRSLQQQAAEMADRTQPATGNTIRATQDKKFIFPNGETATEFEAVVVDFVAMNRFWEGAFDQKNPTPPACFAIAVKPSELVPSKNSPVPQAPNCRDCPMNMFGTAGEGKACKNGRVLALLPPDADENTEMWLLNIQPTAIKAFDSFVSAIARIHQTPPISQIVKISFDENVTYPSIRLSDPQPNPNLPVHFARQAEARELLMTEPDVSQYGKTPPKGGKPAGRGARR